MAPYGTQFYNPQTGRPVQREPYTPPVGGMSFFDPVSGEEVEQAVEVQQPEPERDSLSKLDLYSSWRSIAMDPQYTEADANGKQDILRRFDAHIREQWGANPADLDALVESQIRVIKGEEAPEQLGFGDAISEEARFRKLGLSGGITKKRVEEVKQYLDEQYYKTVEQGGRDHAGFIAGLGGTLTSLASEAAAGGAVGAATGAGVGGVTGAAAGGVGAGPAALAGAALWGGRGALMGGIAGQGIRSRGEALESNYFANLDAGMDSNEAYAKALRSAEISGALNMAAMAVDPTKMSTKLLGVAGKGTVGTAKSVAGTTTKGISEQAARTGAGRFAVEQGTRFGVAGGINAATEVADVAQMRLLGNQDASQYRGTLGQRAALSGLVGGAFHTTVPVLGKAFKGVQTIGDGKSWAGKYNTVFREENIAGAMGQLARDMEDAVTGTPRKELADLDVMARTRDVKDQKQAVKVLKEIWTDITGGTDPINFRVVDEDGFKKLKIADDVDATYQGDYANAAQTITAFTNLFRWDKETGQRIPLMHESAHAFMDTLPQPVVSSLKKLYDTEMENFSPTLDRVDADGNVVRRKNVHPDALDPTVNQTTSFREWFAERMAIANDDWAKGRIDIGKQKRTSATPKGVFDRLSLVYRDKVDKISRRIGLKPEGFNAAFRDFLDSGDAYVFDRTMKDTVYPSRTPIIDDLLATNAMASSLDRALADPRTGAERADSFKRDLLEAGLLEGESIPSARDIDRANEWAAIANVEGRKRARQEVAEIDAPEAAPRMSETELATAQNRVQEIDEALAKKGLSRKERSGLRKEKNQIRQQIGESFLEVERKPRPVSPERRAEGRDTREFAEDPEGFRDQYDAGGAERTKIRKEAQEDLNKILRNRDLAAKKAEREAKAAQKQKAKEDATLKERGYTEDQKTGQLEFETRSPIDKVRAKPIEELTPDELAFEQQALRDQITSETQAQREVVREGATLKNPTDNVEFSKRGVSNAEARAQMKQRVEKAKSKKAKENALKQQQAVEDAAKRVDAENAKHPEALPLQIALNDKGKVSFDKDGKVNYQERDYDIRNHPDIKDKVDSEQTNFLAEKIVRELKTMVKNPQVKAAMGWYGRMRVKLQDLFGADIEVMAQLLGATSARTPVDQNFIQALDGLSQLARGEYDNLMVRYDAHVKEVDARRDAGEFKTAGAYRKAINEFEELPLRSNGKKFNANSAAVRRVLYGHWLDTTNAPKTPNFAGNLTGRTLEATIDVWAARTMRRLLFEPQGGQWRILPAQETAVGSGWAAGRGTGDFYISQRAMGEAARRLKMNPDDLQAVLWYGEKDLWDRNGWTDATGKEKSSFDTEANKLDLDRWNAGVTTWQTKETFDPKVQEAARVRLEASVRQNPDLVSARVVDTEGLYGGDRESSFDIEFSVTKDSDVDTFTREAIRIGEENNQWDVFVSRVVDEDHPNARPAIEVGFKRGVSEDTLQSALRVFDKDVVDGWTIAKSRRGDIIGFRAQFIPEIEHRWAGLKMTEADVIARRDQWQASMRQAIANLSNDVVAFAREHHYDTRVYGREEYANATVAGRDTTLGAELQRRGDALRSDDSGATGNLEYSRRGANARGDGVTGPVRTGEVRGGAGRGGVDFSRRGGDYENVPTRRFPKRAGSSANSRDLKAINERRADIATYEAQGLKDYVDQIDNVADVTLRQSVESLRNRAVESDRNFDVANSIAYLDRLRREYKKVKTPERAAELEAEIESTYAAIAKSGTTLGQLINQYKTFKGIVTEDKVAMFNNYLLSKDRKLTDKDKAEFAKLVDAEEAADAKVIEAREKALASNSMDDIEAVWKLENEAEKAFLAVQKFARTRSPRESKFADWRTAVSGSLLTGVSLMRNFWGNYVNFGAATASRSIAAAVDNVRARITQEDRQVAFAPVEEVKAFVRDSWRETKKLPRKAMHGAAGDKITGEAMRSFAPVAALKQAFTGEGMVVDASTGKVTKLDRLDKVAEAFYGSTAEPMLRGLSVMDDLAKAGARGIRRAEYIKAKKLKQGTKEFTEAMLGMDRDLNKAMDEFALERTYQQDGAAANTMLAIERNLRQSFGEGGVFAYRVLTSPYIKTPVNLAAETMSYAMPSVAVAEGLYKGLVKKDVRGAELAAGKVMVALGLGAMADYLLEDGIISGGPDNSQKVNRARRDSGMGFFRINIDGLRRKLAGEDGTYRAGDETWRLDTLGVAGGAFAVHAEGRRVAEDTTLKSANQTKMDYYLSQDGLASAVGLGRFVMDQTMLRGVALGLDALQSGQLNRVLPNIFNAWVLTPQPFMANNVTQLRAMGHEYKYDTFSANGLASTMEDLYDYKMGNYDGLPLKRDIWGRPVQGTPDEQNAFVFHLLDIRKPEVVRDKARTRLYELYAATGQEDVIPSMPSRNLLLPDGTDLRLSAGLYESYVETVQGAKLQAFEQVVSDPRFNRFYTAQPPQAVELLKKQMDRYGRQATAYWKRTNGQRIYNEYLMLQRQLQETE